MENQNNIPQQNGDVSLGMHNKGTDFIDKFIADGHKNEAGFNSLEAGFFQCRTANDCIINARSQPIPKKLFQSLLFEKELTILVADTGVGKTIFAMQIANEISKTEKVLYLDLELSDKQFQGR